MVDPNRVVRPAPGLEPDLGAALWMLDDTRARTLCAIEGLPPGDVDAIPIGGGNTIGALLYHIAAVDAEWLYQDILATPFPDWFRGLFPYDVREENGRLTSVRAIGLEQHLERLATVRRHVHEDLAALTRDEFRRAPEGSPSGATPEWVLHHLREHEAEHRGQVQEIRTLLAQGR